VNSARTLATLLCAAALATAGPGQGLFKKARKAERAGRYTDAYLLANQAVAREPENPAYWAYAEALQRRGMEGLKLSMKPAAPAPAADPGAESTPPPPAVTDQDYAEAREALPPPILKCGPGRRDFDIKGDSRAIFQGVTEAFGLKVVFDSDFDGGKPARFQMAGAACPEALRAAEAVTGSFLVAVSDRLGLVARDTQQKRVEIEPVMSVFVPFPEPLAIQDVMEGARAVQTSFDMQRIGIDNARRAVLFRDRVSRLRPAIELFRQLMQLKAQVLVEMELLTVDETSALNYGLRHQTNFPIVSFGSVPGLRTVVPTAGPGMVGIGGGRSLIGVGLTDGALFASLARTYAHTVWKAQVLAVDGQAANLHVGDRYPIVTMGFFGPGENPGHPYTPPPTINFEELGLVFKATPKVHSAEEVSIELDADFKSLSGMTINGIPIISQRDFNSRVRMKFGQAAVIAGLVRATDSLTVRGMPLLKLLPGLRTDDRTRETTQVLLVVTPRLVHLPPWEVSVPEPVVSGSETRPLTPLE
jgi:hypothetical protein